jgi:Flp pilus assembly protein TadD
MEASSASPRDGSNHALLRLEQGDEDGYRKACRTLIARFGKSTDASAANSIAWACALGPEALSDLKPAVALGRHAVQARPNDPNIRNTLGAVLHRAGQHKDAVAELNASIKLSTSGGTPADFLFLAMAHHKLSQADEARKWLKQAQQAPDRSPPTTCTNQVTYRLLRREAEALIQPAAKGEKE